MECKSLKTLLSTVNDFRAMLQNRVIPCLLLQDKGLVKTEKFREPKYVGDPINAVKIFNTKEVDELIFLDTMASKTGNRPLSHVQNTD